MPWTSISQAQPPLLLIHLLDTHFEGFVRIPDPQGDVTIHFRQGLPVRAECQNPATAGWSTGQLLLALFAPAVEKIEIEKMSITGGSPVNPLPWIRKGLIEKYDLARLEHETRELAKCRFTASPKLDSCLTHFEFSDQEMELVRNLSEPHTIAELRAASSLSFKEILVVLYCLAACRMLQPVREGSQTGTIPASPAPAKETAENAQNPEEKELQNLLQQLSASNPFERLGLPFTATMEEIDARFKELAKKLHPDTIARKGLSSMLQAAQEAFSRLTEAYDLLKNEQTREKYRKSESKEDDSEVRRVLEAEMLYQKGIIHYRRREYDLAEQAFLEARQKHEDGSHLAMWAWLRYINPGNDKKAVREEVKAALQKAVQLTPREADFYFYLGKVCADMDQIASARQYFIRAVELNNDHIEAARELRLLERRQKNASNPIAQATGTFLNMFKKK